MKLGFTTEVPQQFQRLSEYKATLFQVYMCTEWYDIPYNNMLQRNCWMIVVFDGKQVVILCCNVMIVRPFQAERQLEISHATPVKYA